MRKSLLLHVRFAAWDCVFYTLLIACYWAILVTPDQVVDRPIYDETVAAGYVKYTLPQPASSKTRKDGLVALKLLSPFGESVQSEQVDGGHVMPC